MKRALIAATVTVVAALSLTGCGDKYTQQFKDAGRGASNTQKADTGTMPDGFSNYATKCDRPGIRVYVLFHGDSQYGSISTIADPNCK